MKKLILKCFLYGALILVSLEIMVRVFHLHKDTPSRFVDEYEVEKWVPNQNGYAVTGNRRQNFSEYRINNAGFNSYREFNPTKEHVEIALVGDSFIEGFHQPYYRSIGKKIEDKIQHIEVYEYGYAGYDFADQLHLINAYKAHFDLIDQVILGIKFNNDLTRGKYTVIQDRLALQSPFNQKLKQIKLLVYAKSIGLLDPPKYLIRKMSSLVRSKAKISEKNKKDSLQIQKRKEEQYLSNFKSLVNLYGFDKSRYTLLLDSSITPSVFLSYLDKNNFKYIDFNPTFSKSKGPTTLIYDRHWNNHGRNLIAQNIVSYLQSISLQN